MIQANIKKDKDIFQEVLNFVEELRDTLGFTVVPYLWNAAATPYVDEYVVNVLTDQAKELGYPIDGLVFKFNSVAYGKTLGKTAHHFNNAIAYKFYDETYKTTVKDIEWTMGRTGVLTPVAILEPIEIDGATIERANCHNLSVLKELKLEYQNQEVEIYRANQIIPQISKVYPYEHKNVSIPITIPEVCPICGEKTEVLTTDGSEFLICGNPQCQGKLVNRLDHFCGKKGLDIKGLSKATLEKLIDWGWASNISDIMTLSQYKTDWVKKPGFGTRSVEKILNSKLLEYLTNKLDKEVYGMVMPLVTDSTGKKFGKSGILTLFFLMRVKRRSRGPSNASTRKDNCSIKQTTPKLNLTMNKIRHKGLQRQEIKVRRRKKGLLK